MGHAVLVSLWFKRGACSWDKHLFFPGISIVLPLDFLRMPFIALIAYWVWGETFSPWTAVGAAIIFSSSYFAIMRERKVV